jgi:hypothetical protein
MSSPPRPGILLGTEDGDTITFGDGQPTPGKNYFTPDKESEKTLTPEFVKQNYGQLRNLLTEHEKREKLKGVMGTTPTYGEGERPFTSINEPYVPAQVWQGNSDRNTRSFFQRKDRDIISPVRRMADLSGSKKSGGRTKYDEKDSWNDGEGEEEMVQRRNDLTAPYQRRMQSRFTQRIAKAPRPERLRMPSHVKTYDGSSDPDDHLSLFCAAAENQSDWTMPIWCHMFEQTLVGPARLWFNNLPGASIDSFDDLQDMFEAHFMHQRRYERDPVEIHNIRQREHEPILDFLKRFNQESMEIRGAPEGMKVSGFMHAIRNKQLAEYLGRVVPQSMMEAEQRTREFLRGKEAAALTDDRFRKEGRSDSSWRRETPFRGQEGLQRPRPMMGRREEKRGDERGGETRRNEGRRRGIYLPFDGKTVFTALLKTPCEILSTEAAARKFIPPTTGKNLTGPADRYCEFHQGTGHHTNDCYQLKKRIERAVQSGELAHLVKDIRGGPGEGEKRPRLN